MRGRPPTGLFYGLTISLPVDTFCHSNDCLEILIKDCERVVQRKVDGELRRGQFAAGKMAGRK